jgi:hypothetical protein
MSNLFNKALIFKEKKTVGFVAILIFLVVFLFKVIPIALNMPISEDDILKNKLHNYNVVKMSTSEAYQSPQKPIITQTMVESENASFFIRVLLKNNHELFDVTMIFLILVMCFIQMFPDRWGKYESISYSLPVKKGLIMLHKLLLGFVIIISSVMLNGFIILAQYYINKSLLINFILPFEVIQWTIITLLSYCSIYALFMFVFSVCGNIFAGAIMSPLIMLYPLYFSAIIGAFSEVLQKKIPSYLLENFSLKITNHYVYKVFVAFTDSISLFMYSGRYNYQHINYNGISLNELPVIEVFWGTNVFLLLSITFLFAFLAIHYFDNNMLEKRHRIIQFNGVQKAFILFFTIGFTTLTTLVLDMLFFGGQRYGSYGSLAIFVLIFFLSLITGILISNKLMNIGRKNSNRILKLKKGVLKA